MFTRRLGIAAMTLLVCLVGSASFAHDLAPPQWRGEDFTTFQEWIFSTDANPASPEVCNNQCGSPVAAITVGEFGSGWFDRLPGLGEQEGYWDLGGDDGSITVTIPNFPSPPESYKLIRIQVTYYRDINQAPTVTISGGTLIDSGEILVESVPTGGSWVLSWSDWQMVPNPASETIVFTGAKEWGSVIDQIAIDTKCTVVPEPSSLYALAIGSTALLWFRRRR